MRLMIDTNIILDVLLKREPFYTQSRTVLDLCEKRQISGFVSASSVTDIFYIIRRTLHDTEVTYKAIDLLLNIVGILDVTAEDVYSAFAKQAKDFEDCLLAECAILILMFIVLKKLCCLMLNVRIFKVKYYYSRTL